MSILGVSKVVESDNGPEFVNRVVKELTVLKSIDHRTISP